MTLLTRWEPFREFSIAQVASFYSSRSATMGSTLAARRAGM